MAPSIDQTVKALAETAFRKGCSILERKRPILEASARELLFREALGPRGLGELTAKLDRTGGSRPTLAAVR